MNDLLLLSGVFVACLLEAVEALTIVLAVGTTRNWRSALQGVAVSLMALAIIVGVLGPALTSIPIAAVRFVIGLLLLMVGLQWLRKAILRAGGYLKLRNENHLFAQQEQLARSAPARARGIVSDWYGFTVAFKGVLLEGLEVAFIVVAFGAGQRHFGPAAAAAIAAVLVVVLAGVLVRRPLARIPGNALKFCVGILLTSLGTFWAGEGAGIPWPGDDASKFALLLINAIAALALVTWLRSRNPVQTRQVA